VAQIILEVESKYQALGEAFKRLLDQVQARREAAVADGAALDYGQVEQEVAQAIAALKREAHQVVLSALDAKVSRKDTP
jgi:hypothetical protein